MKKKSSFLMTAWILTFFCVLLFATDCNELFAANKGTISAGTAKVIITPKVPIQMAGYGGRKEPFKGVNDDLFLRVIAFSDGVNKAAIMAADIIGITFPFWEETIKLIESETGIPKENILLCGTHTHGGPNYRLSRYESPPPEVISYRNELKEKFVPTLKEAIDTVLNKTHPGIAKGTLNAYRNDYRLFFRIMLENVEEAEV